MKLTTQFLLTLLFSLFLFSCKKSPEELVPPAPGTLADFVMSSINRNMDSVNLEWSASIYSIANTAVKYKVRMSNGLEKNTDTERKATFILDKHKTYTGKVIAYVDGGDSNVLNFTIADYSGMIILGRNDQAQNQNVVEAYNVYSGDLIWKTNIGSYFQNVFNEPVVSNDTVFVPANTSNGNLLYALKLKTGELIYSTISNNGFTLGHLTYSRGKLFAVYATKLLCINAASGNIEWTKNPEDALGYFGKQLVVSNTVYTATATIIPGVKDKFRALDFNNGTTKWSFDYEGFFTGEALFDNGHIYFPTSIAFYCLNAETGALVWEKPGDANFSPSRSFLLTANKIIMPGNGTYATNCLNKQDGSLLWRYLNAPYAQTTISAENGIGYFSELYPDPNFRHIITAIDLETGLKKWSVPSTYQFSYCADNRIYSRSNFASDVEVRSATDGAFISKIINPNNYYTDNLVRYSLFINNKFYNPQF